MKTYHVPLIAIAAVAAAAPVAAQRLVMPAPPGFVLGYEATQGRNLVREFVPRGQTVQNYTKMISSHRMAGMGVIPSPTFVARWAKAYIARCPRATAIAQPFGTRAGGVRVDCARHPATGRPETVLARAIQAGPDMFLVFVTFRYFPMPRDTQWARDQLGAISIAR